MSKSHTRPRPNTIARMSASDPIGAVRLAHLVQALTLIDPRAGGNSREETVSRGLYAALMAERRAKPADISTAVGRGRSATYRALNIMDEAGAENPDVARAIEWLGRDLFTRLSQFADEIEERFAAFDAALENSEEGRRRT